MKVLIVEDEIIVSMDLENRLEEIGFEVVGIARNYDDAVALYHTEQPDIMFLDINIDGSKSGLDVARTITQSKVDLPLVFLSAYSNEKTMNEVHSFQNTLFIKKPFNNTDINTVLHAFLKQ